MQRQLVFKVLPFKSRAKIGSKNQILQSSEFKSFSSCYYKDLNMLPFFFSHSYVISLEVLKYLQDPGIKQAFYLILMI